MKTNFKNISECERQLYNTVELLKAHKISPAESNAICRVCDSWVKTRKAANSDELIRRIEGLEVLTKAQQKAVK